MAAGKNHPRALPRSLAKIFLFHRAEARSHLAKFYFFMRHRVHRRRMKDCSEKKEFRRGARASNLMKNRLTGVRPDAPTFYYIFLIAETFQGKIRLLWVIKRIFLLHGYSLQVAGSKFQVGGWRPILWTLISPNFPFVQRRLRLR